MNSKQPCQKTISIHFNAKNRFIHLHLSMPPLQTINLCTNLCLQCISYSFPFCIPLFIHFILFYYFSKQTEKINESEWNKKCFSAVPVDIWPDKLDNIHDRISRTNPYIHNTEPDDTFQRFILFSDWINIPRRVQCGREESTELLTVYCFNFLIWYWLVLLCLYRKHLKIIIYYYEWYKYM